MANDTLTSGFVTELMAAAISKRTMMDITRQHLKYSFLQTEAEKKVWQWTILRYDKTGRIPTIGQLQQQFIDNDDALDLISDMKDLRITDEKIEPILDSFEEYIKQMKFLEANDKIADAYNRGKKDEAYQISIKFSEEIKHFSIKSAKFETVFGDFTKRQIQRKSADWSYRFKVPTNIDEVDYRLGGANGGPETGECVLWLGDSGVGKSQLGVHLGIAAARGGHRVAHFQLEGTKEQCLNRYDAAWTGTLYHDVKSGDIPDKTMEISQRIVKKLCKNDIIVSSEETFNAKTLPELRNELKEMERTHGPIACVIIDYLELLEVGDGILYHPKDERFRQAKLAKGCKGIAMELNCVVHAFTQASSISEEEKNDPEFVLTRANLSEDKGKIRPFDVFFTLNQTRDEYSESRMRLHSDKLRDYRIGAQIVIYNNFDFARFYDRKKTINSVEYED